MKSSPQLQYMDGKASMAPHAFTPGNNKKRTPTMKVYKNNKDSEQDCGKDCEQGFYMEAEMPVIFYNLSWSAFIFNCRHAFSPIRRASIQLLISCLRWAHSYHIAPVFCKQGF